MFKLSRPNSAFIGMDIIDEIKFKLKKLISPKIDRSSAVPLRIFEEKGKFILILKNLKPPPYLLSARSLEGFDFDQEEHQAVYENYQPNFPFASVVPNYSLKHHRLMYYGDKNIFLAKSDVNQNWIATNKILIHSPYSNQVGGAFLYKQGIILLYLDKFIEKGLTFYRARLAGFDKNKPDRLLWKTEDPVWSSQDHWQNKKIKPLGSILLKNQIVMYWYVDEKIIYGIHLSGFLFNPKKIKSPVKLKKHTKNPIIHPRKENDWEAFNTLNPAAVYIDNKVHILYRAQGYDYISSFGYAVSSDGVNIENRLDYPVYGPKFRFETNNTGKVNPDLMSAGGFGGCEDPRMTLIGDRVYLVYVAFDGWTNLRLALTSIDVFDFLNHRWNWEKPVLISPPHVIDKSGCLLPEKINGKYVFFHRVFPNILIDYVDDLNFRGKQRWLTGKHKIKVRPQMWDSRKIGAGAPPLKTKDGWLLIYYGVGDRDASKYHIGAMLLDHTDPTRVLNRSDKPILSPNQEYENNGFKPGIAYPCGAVIIKDNLFVYYGAADSTVCVASANVNTFLNDLKSGHPPHLTPIKIKEVNF